MKTTWLTILIGLAIVRPVFSETPVQVVVDGQKISSYVDQKTGRTMVPVRFIAERLGVSVQWKGAQNQVVFRGKGQEIIVTLAQNFALVNGKKMDLDAPAVIKNQRAMVPLRFISEGFGVEVKWTPSQVVLTIPMDIPRGIWLWDAKIIETESGELLKFASDNGLDRVYLQVNRDVDEIFYRQFIRRAGEQGLAVEALGGAPRWARKENHHEILRFIDWVRAYNTSTSYNFAGLHFDIEPYLLDDWNTKREDVIRNWMDTIRLIEKETQGTGLKVGYDVPFWIYQFNVPGDASSFSSWLLEKVDQLVIMDYRNFALGKNGIVENARPILEEAAKLGKQVIVSVDTARSKEGDHTTFYLRSVGEMERELELAAKELSRYSSFAGYAIHDYKNWRLMK